MTDVHTPLDPFWSLMDQQIDREWDQLAVERALDEEPWLYEGDFPAPTEQWEDGELYSEPEPFDYEELGRIMFEQHVSSDGLSGYEFRVFDRDWEDQFEDLEPEDFGVRKRVRRADQLWRPSRRSHSGDSWKMKSRNRKAWVRGVERHNERINHLLTSDDLEAVEWREKILEIDRQLRQAEQESDPEWLKKAPAGLSKEARRKWEYHKWQVQAAVRRERDRQRQLEHNAQYEDLERQRELQLKRTTGFTEAELELCELQWRIDDGTASSRDIELWELYLSETELGRRYRDYREMVDEYAERYYEELERRETEGFWIDPDDPEGPGELEPEDVGITDHLKQRFIQRWSRGKKASRSSRSFKVRHQIQRRRARKHKMLTRAD